VPPPLHTDAATRDLMLEALDAAKRAGASWADVRISRNRNGSVQARERQVTDVVDTDTMGCGVRALVDGTGGSAPRRAHQGGRRRRGAGGGGDREGQPRGARPARRAGARARAPNATWRGAYVTDPFTVPVEQKADLLLRANARRSRWRGALRELRLAFVKEERNYANTDGSVITQDYVRAG
jgi:TldD protein